MLQGQKKETETLAPINRGGLKKTLLARILVKFVPLKWFVALNSKIIQKSYLI